MTLEMPTPESILATFNAQLESMTEKLNAALKCPAGKGRRDALKDAIKFVEEVFSVAVQPATEARTKASEPAWDLYLEAHEAAADKDFADEAAEEAYYAAYWNYAGADNKAWIAYGAAVRPTSSALLVLLQPARTALAVMDHVAANVAAGEKQYQNLVDGDCELPALR